MSAALYKPYSSDSDSDSGSESDTSMSSDSSSSSYASLVAAPPRNFRALADGLSLVRVGAVGPVLPGTAIVNPPMGSFLSPGLETFADFKYILDISGNKELKKKEPVDNIIMLSSSDRDRNVFIQPTNVTLRLPRVYSKITKFQLTQIKLLSAFFYFRADKNNLDLSILELGRTNQDTFGNSKPAIIKNNIRPGTYNINTLLTEITTQLNYTPVFYDFPNGFQDFAPRFAATGDFTINFNFPGDTYYNSLLNEFQANPTALSIVTLYFKGQYAGYSSYTIDEIKVAYYYPVLKEFLLDDDYGISLFLNLDIVTPVLPGETVTSRCIYTFQGLDDPVIQEVISLNVTVLDTYRLNHTFRYFLINKYNVSYESQSNRVTFASPSLNTSLVNLITYKQSQFFSEQLNAQGITSAEYTTFNTQNTILLAVLNDMFYYLERWLAVYFAVNFNTYSLDYLATPQNLIGIVDGFQAIGISSNFDANIIARNQKPINTNILAPLRQSAKQYWNRLTDLSNSTIPFPYNLETGNPSTSSNFPYSILLEQRDAEHSFVDSNEHIYANRLTRYADILVPIDPTSYTVFKFKSPVRQTLQVETLPRPTQYRYPAYNKANYDLSAQKLFDNSYCFIQNTQNDRMDVTDSFAYDSLLTIPGFTYANSTMNFGIDYNTSAALWGSTIETVQVGETRGFYELYTPLPTNYRSSMSAGYRYPMSFTLAVDSNTSSFVTPMNMYLYHDRAAFMADVSGNRNENPINYLKMISTTVQQSTATINWDVYGNQKYYILARSIETAIARQNYTVVPWFPAQSNYTALTSSIQNFNPFADPQTPAALSNFNYAVNADPAYIRLPIQPAIQTTQTRDALYSTITYSTVAIGYDTNGVSTDLTHYTGFVNGAPQSNGIPNATIRIDPISAYVFEVDRGYDPNKQEYLNTNGNVVLFPEGKGLYTPGTVPARETSIINWYGSCFLPNSENQPPMFSQDIANTSAIVPYSRTLTNQPLRGYTYAGSNNAIQFGDGVMGVGFVPQQGVWDIHRVMFKSIYNTGDSNVDENLHIQYIGVYYSAITVNHYAHEIDLADAIAVLKFNKSVVYNSNSQDLGFDAAGGTYYEYVRDSNYRVGSNSYLYGYSQIRRQINTDIHSIYSLIPFDGNSQLMTFTGLVGSPVPYPYYSDASAGIAYFDGTRASNGNGIVVPRTKTVPDTTRGPPAGYDETQYQYEQSSPLGTNLLQYITPYPFALLSNTIKAWDPLPYAPSVTIGDVSGFIMTQDSYYRVFEYKADENDYSLLEKYQFSVDQIFPTTNPELNYIGVAGNENVYAFFAYSNLPVNSPDTSHLIIKTMDPFSGAVVDTYDIMNIPGLDPTTQEITNITYNNFGGFTMAIQSPSNLFAVCKHTGNNSSMTVLQAVELTGFNSNVDRLITRQSQKEEFGAFYVYPYRTQLAGPIADGIIDYISVTPSNIIGNPNPYYKYIGSTGNQDTFTQQVNICQIQTFNLSNAGSNPKILKEPIVCRAPFKDLLYTLSDYDTQRFYQITTFTSTADPKFSSNAFTTQSVYQFPQPTSNFIQGANGSKWSVIGNILYGNRNDIVDAPRKINQAWQLFYPVQRIVMEKVAKNFTFMYDLSGLKYPEYPHTSIIGYNSLAGLNADTTNQWGLENSNNFEVADFAFQGTTFNSYLFTMPLEARNDPYYLAVRNYSPTEKSQVLMRFSLTNLYDYGYVSMSDLSDEVIISQSSSNMFSPDYYNSLNNFNSNFIFGSNGKIFGANVIAGYSGSNFSNVTGFGDFYSRFLAIYNQYNTQVNQVQTINNNVNASLSNFIQTDLQYILPPTSLNRQRFTDPLTYSILWRSSLYKNYMALDDNWGLGWNLGFDKRDTAYNTVQQGASFFKILDDFINLQVSREFDMNRMDTGAKENLSLTKESTGVTKAFHAKLLLAPFGSYATTLISNPISFNPPVSRMDKLTFTWVDITGATINNADCEWNVVLQLTEG